MLILSRKKDESIIIGDNIEVVVTGIEDEKVKLGIKAPKNIDIHRKEVHIDIQNENREAAKNEGIDINSLKGLFDK